MKFTLSAAVLAFAVYAAALPQHDVNAAGNGVGNKGNANVRFPVPDDMTIKQATEKCGDQAQLSCCNKATYAGDVTDIDQGILAGTLKNLIGGGSGSEGLGLFDQCSKLDLQGTPFLLLRRVIHTDIIQSPFLLSPSRISSTRSASRTLPAARTLLPMPYVPSPQRCVVLY